MKGLLFLGFVILLVGIIAFFSIPYKPTKEGFVSVKGDPQIVVPKVKPSYKATDVSSPAPYLPPIENTYGPAFGEIARVNTLPYRDPSLQPAPFKRLQELLEDVNGFLAFEADSLAQRSDPAIQLPLITLRGDRNRLDSEVRVLKRNPGIDSQLTQGDVDDIRANLIYLQKIYRLSVNNEVGVVEGFETQEDGRATLEELKDLLLRIQVEITRLSASGTTDPVFTARVALLTNIQNDVANIVREVENGTRPAADIPIMKKDLQGFLPIMGDPQKPLRKLIDYEKLPPALSNLFPAYSTTDISGARMAQYLFKQYGDAVFKGMSWSVHLDYTAPRALQKAQAEAAAAGALGAVSVGGGGVAQMNRLPRGEFEEATQDMQLKAIGQRAVPQAPLTTGIDWKAKTAAICDSIRRRGLNPADFGCVKDMGAMGDSYSWRGHARMVCQRLLTTPDPSLPEVCGCPPLNWAGWRS